MPTYEQKLTQFAQGKRLLRLARPIRDRADSFCDACGSIQPRTLYALEDLDSERHYFVGDTCLKELAKRGAILRYGRHSGRVAFENEMKLRAQEFEADKGTNTHGGPHSNPGEQQPSVITYQLNPGNEALLRVGAMVEIAASLSVATTGSRPTGGTLVPSTR